MILAVRFRQAAVPKQESEEGFLLEEQLERHVATKREHALSGGLHLARHVEGHRASVRRRDGRAQHHPGRDLRDGLLRKEPGAKVRGRLLERRAVFVGQLGDLDVEQRPEHLPLDERRGVTVSRDLQDRHRLSGRVACGFAIAQPQGGAKPGDLLLEPRTCRIGLGLGPDLGDGVAPGDLVERCPGPSRTTSATAAGVIIRTGFVVTSASTRSTAAMIAVARFIASGRTSVRSNRQRSAGAPSSVSFFGSRLRNW